MSKVDNTNRGLCPRWMTQTYQCHDDCFLWWRTELCWKCYTLLSISAVHQTFYISICVSTLPPSTLYVYFTDKRLCCNIVYPQWLHCLVVRKKIRSLLNNSSFRLCYFHHTVRCCDIFCMRMYLIEDARIYLIESVTRIGI